MIYLIEIVQLKTFVSEKVLWKYCVRNYYNFLAIKSLNEPLRTFFLHTKPERDDL